MAKGSENQFPHVTITEQASTPATPAAGDQKLFIDDADHHLKRVDENDAVVDIESGGGAGSDTTAIHDNVSGEIAAIAEKTTLHNDDLFLIEDSESSNAKKRVKKSNVSTGGGGAPTDAKYVVSEANGTLSAEIIIPRIASDPDIRVAAANDDEFDTTDVSDPMTGWTTLGSPTTHDINSTFKSHYYVNRAGGGGVNWVGIYKAAPSTPFVVTARISGVTSRTDYQSGGLFIGEASPGKFDIIEIIRNGSYYRLQADQFSNPTGSASLFYGASAEGLARPPIYLRISVASSTDISYYFSPDGYIYTMIVASRNPGFTVGSVGVAVSPTASANAIEMAVDWIRFT